MPVLRKREQVRNTQQGSVVRSAPDGMAQGIRQNAQQLARQAADYARGLAVAAEDEAKALAKAAVFSTGPNGLPQMPPNAAERMGTIARRTYDAAIEQRYAAQMTSAIQAQISDAQNGNLYDLDAFLGDAQGRIDQLALDVPQGMEGMFQQISTGLMVDAGASIGYRQANLAIENARSTLPSQIDAAVNTFNEQVFAGDSEGAQATLAATLDFIDRQPDHVLNAGERQQQRENLVFQAGIVRMTADLGLGDNPTTSQLTDLAARLMRGDDPELMKFFAMPGQEVGDRAMAQRAASYVNQLIGQANSYWTGQADTLERQGRVNALRVGQAEDSAANRAALDVLIGEDLGLPNGAQPTDWFQMGDDGRHAALMAVKTAGIVPASLKGALHQMNASRDPALLEQGYLIYRDLMDAPNSDGQVVNMVDVMGDDLVALFGLVDVMHADGGDFNESITSAIGKFDALEGQEWSDEHLAQMMNGAGVREKWRTPVNRDTARTTMEREVRKQIFDGIESLPDEEAEAFKLMETYLRTEGDWEAALTMTKQSMNGRWVESDAMLASSRSAYAPEKHYATPPAGSIPELLGRAFDTTAANGVHALEFLTEIPARLIPGDIPDNWRVDYGADRMNASPFELLADTAIRDMIEAMPGPMGDELDTGWDMFKGGRDYWLVPDKRSGVPPVYAVWMRGPNGTKIPLPGVLDVREDWKVLMETSAVLDAVTPLRNRAHQAATDMEEIMLAVREGRSPVYEDLVKRYLELYGETDE